MLSVVIVLLPVVVSNWIVIPTRLRNFSANVGLNLAQREERHHAYAPGNPVRTSESIASEFGDGALASFDKWYGRIFSAIVKMSQMWRKCEEKVLYDKVC